MNGNRAWLYCRAANGKNSADVLMMQAQRLEAYAREHDFEIVGRSKDAASGRTAARSGLLEFKAAMERQKVDILLLFNLSCLGRNSEEVARYWRSLRKHNVRLCTVAEGEVYLDMRSLFLELFSSK